MYDTLEALHERVPALELPLGRVQAIITPILVFGITLALLLWIGSVSALGGLILALVVMGGCALLAREAVVSSGTRPYEGLFFYLILPLLGLHSALLLSLAWTGAEDLLPAWLAWPIFFYLLLTGLGLLGRSLGEAGLSGWILLDAGPPQGSVHTQLQHPALAGLARVALALAVASGTALALLVAVIYAWVLLPSWVRSLQPLRTSQTDHSLWPGSLLGEARLLAALIDPLSPPRSREAPLQEPEVEEPAVEVPEDEDEIPIEFTDENSDFSDESSEAEVIELIHREE